MKEGKSVWNWIAIVGCVLAIAVCCTVLRGGDPTDVEQSAVACAARSERYLVPVGRTVGIKLFSRGVMVVALSEIETTDGMVWPARDCGLAVGDIITEINHTRVNSIEEVEREIGQTEHGALSIQALRDGKSMEMEAEAASCQADGSYKLGAWLRDSMAGIGTVTWYDPDSHVFAALGHGINDVDTGRLIPVRSGGIMASTVSAVVKGERAKPGQLHGTFDLTEDVGTLFANSTGGVFGRTDSTMFDGEPVPVAGKNEVHTGAAVIRCNVEGNQVEEYTVELLRIYPELGDSTRNLLLQVNDKRLLERTGGIVQGMSGSPVIQDGKLVGAVTHVLVNDPTRGYGIFAENMLESVS
jgi:stage IV sporulation protein B